MWCVIQVYTGKEEKMRRACIKYIDESILQETFIPQRIRRRKYAGVWRDERCSLFPGYVFLITDDPVALYSELKKVEGMTKLLRADRDILTLSPAEEELMRKLGDEEHVTRMSYGIIEGDKITVTDGPLKGLEGLIKRIDRHKRQCIVETEMFGQRSKMTVGIEIVSKT